MPYVFVPAFHRYGIRKGPVQAFCVHMAEGGGTVGFLSRPNANGVSVHYVVEYSGRIVQMLHEREASGSINPNDLRSTDGPPPYGATVRREVMGAWDHDPNSALISCEVEGFAATGPNAKQQLALARLVRDVRSRVPAMGLLGHRDFQDYKACPGAHIPWTLLGGHGPHGQTEGASMAVQITTQPVYSHVLPVQKGEAFYGDAGLTDQLGAMSTAQKVPYLGPGIGGSSRAVIVVTGTAYDDGTPRPTQVFVRREAGTPEALPPAPDQPVVLAPGVYRVQ